MGLHQKKPLRLYGTEKLCSEFGEDRFINNVTFLSTDAGRTDGQTGVYLVYSVQCICTALDRRKRVGRVTKCYAAVCLAMHVQQSLIFQSLPTPVFTKKKR